MGNSLLKIRDGSFVFEPLLLDPLPLETTTGVLCRYRAVKSCSVKSKRKRIPRWKLSSLQGAKFTPCCSDQDARVTLFESRLKTKQEGPIWCLSVKFPNNCRCRCKKPKGFCTCDRYGRIGQITACAGLPVGNVRILHVADIRASRGICNFGL